MRLLRGLRIYVSAENSCGSFACREQRPAYGLFVRRALISHLFRTVRWGGKVQGWRVRDVPPPAVLMENTPVSFLYLVIFYFTSEGCFEMVFSTSKVVVWKSLVILAV